MNISFGLNQTQQRNSANNPFSVFSEDQVGMLVNFDKSSPRIMFNEAFINAIDQGLVSKDNRNVRFGFGSNDEDATDNNMYLVVFTNLGNDQTLSNESSSFKLTKQGTGANKKEVELLLSKLELTQLEEGNHELLLELVTSETNQYIFRVSVFNQVEEEVEEVTEDVEESVVDDLPVMEL